MNREFVPYEQAIALKELGFDEPCFGCWRSSLIPSNFTEFFLDIEFGMNESPRDWINSNFLNGACSAPIYQQAFRFFREKGFLIDLSSHSKDEHEYYIQWEPDETFISDGYNIHEEMELECLKKLIEIVKNK